MQRKGENTPDSKISRKKEEDKTEIYNENYYYEYERYIYFVLRRLILI